MQIADEILKERFFAKVVKGKSENDCWKWIGATYKFGYGCIGIGGRNDGAHRVSYRLHKGEIPEGMCVCHSCDNPECSNPNHLFLGTKKDNAVDRNAKGRGKNPIHRGNHPLARLTIEQVKEIKYSGKPKKELAEHFGATMKNINRIISGNRWGWV